MDPENCQQHVKLPAIVSPGESQNRTVWSVKRTPTPRPVLPMLVEHLVEDGSPSVHPTNQTGCKSNQNTPTRGSVSTRGIISSNGSYYEGRDSNRTNYSQNSMFGFGSNKNSVATVPRNSRRSSYSSALMSSSSQCSTTSSSCDVSSSWLEVTNQSFPSFVENDWMSDSENEDVEQIMRMNVITNEDNLNADWNDSDVKNQLLVEILQIVQYPDFSVNLEDYGIRVKKLKSAKGVLSVKITKHKKKEDDDDDKDPTKRRRRKKRKRAWANRNLVQAKFQKEEKTLVKETRRFQYSVEMSKLLATTNSAQRRSSRMFRRPLIVALRDLSLIDKQDRAEKFLHDLSASNLPPVRNTMASRLTTGGGRATRQQMSRLSQAQNSTVFE